MSEYMKDSGHRTMRTCDDCGGAFFCGDVEDWDEGEDDSAPDWTCETCTKKDATIKALADALESVKTRVLGFQHAESCQAEDDDQESIEGCDCPLQLVPQIDAALRLAGRL